MSAHFRRFVIFLFCIVVMGTVFLGIADAACTTNDIEVLSLDSRRDSVGYLWFNGELRNNCGSPVGVQIRLELRDKAGRLVTSKEFWPASIRNIQGGDTQTIRQGFRPDEIQGVSKYGVRVIEVKRWN